VLEFDIYPGRENKVDLVLYENGAPIPNHTAITRAVIYMGSTKFDSEDVPSLIDLTNTDRIVFDPASANPALVDGKYNCELIVYDALDYASGYVWPVEFTVRIRPEPGPT